ncbi:MAG: CAP domain-containing protein [Coleofasciculaceae cyanobacterium]
MMQKRLILLGWGGLILTLGLGGCSVSEQDLSKISEEVATKINRSLPPIKVSQEIVFSPSKVADLTSLEKSVYQKVNQYRKSKKLPPLKLNSAISQQARKHSQAMAKGNVPFSHDGFDDRIKAIAESLQYRSAAENVAFNQGYQNPDQQAVEGWIKSTGHRKNMEGNFDTTGIGVSKNAEGEYYLTQIFIKRR